ncbi:DUF2066 domain-containing protein [Zobellella denitrificans]|uniref:DUF2066 domain-containing protein n=1 Tax=Zobellella denitrificans TaxID=347534 RepID=A0A291HRD3_9GAMM|nr:DUF2066 domain-containing protein [Zobellella denitrificans]ATG74720.1 hypothetical protein AN401_13335 [Zobellella denitrificans]
MLKTLLLAAMALLSSVAVAQPLLEVTLDPAPYSRDEARAQALELVLDRLTGDRARDSWIREEALAEPERYLRDEPQGSGYSARFDGEELRALIDSAGLPFSLDPRPALLVWQLDQGQARSEADADWRRASSAYPLPLLWPLWDLEEHMAIDKSRLFDEEQLREASRRYGADYWLALEREAQGGRWQLYAAGQDGALLQGRLEPDAGLLELASALNRYWVERGNGGGEPARADNPDPVEPLQLQQDGAGELTIVVSGLRQFSDAIRLEQRLRQLDGVEQVYLMDSAGHQARYRLLVPGSRAAVLQALAAVAGLSASGERQFNWSGTASE